MKMFLGVKETLESKMVVRASFWMKNQNPLRIVIQNHHTHPAHHPPKLLMVLFCDFKVFQLVPLELYTS